MWDMDEDDGAGATMVLADNDKQQLARADDVRMTFDNAGDGLMSIIVQAAQGLDRHEDALIARAKQIGSLLGKRGFYRWTQKDKRTGKTEVIEGESVHLAQALAQEWGGIIYQTRVVHAEQLASGGRRLQLRSSVADLKKFVLKELDAYVTTSAPPGKFGRNHEQAERWHAQQLQSAGSKVERNAILDVLPKWYTGAAFEAAKATDAGQALGIHPKGHPREGQPRTLAEARQGSLEFLISLGCHQVELEQYVDYAYDLWAAPQISMLRELAKLLHRGTISIEQWRASLQEANEENSVDEKPRKSALGLPASNGNGVHDAALKAAINADAEKQKAEAKVEQQSEPQAGPEMAEAEAAQQAAAEQGEQAALPIDDKKTSKRGK